MNRFSLLFIVVTCLNSYAQESTKVRAEQEVERIVDRFTQITGPDDNCSDTISELENEIDRLTLENRSLQAKAEELKVSNDFFKEELIRSSKQYIISEYGFKDQNIRYDEKQYNEFKDNYYIQNYVQEKGDLVVFFPFNKAEVDLSLYIEFDQLVNKLESNKNYKIVITGYSDSKGNEELNGEISQKRAETIKTYLRDKYKISNSLIDIEGKGMNAEERINDKKLDFLNRMAIIKVVPK